ncbi:hypothetical protein [Streptomyces sp. NPDC002785]|uniref:hypothetical protein n=1 Tax=Streptomyces sp. NPDC002785 TaxID=3154543 RepID=UPI0033306D29
MDGEGGRGSPSPSRGSGGTLRLPHVPDQDEDITDEDITEQDITEADRTGERADPARTTSEDAPRDA